MTTGDRLARRAVVVFARAPEEEARAKPLLRVARADVELHRALLDRALAEAAALVGVDVVLATTGDLAPARRAALAHVPAARLHVVAQRGASFGQRLSASVEHAFDAGYEQVVVVGGDAPELGASDLRAAFESLDGVEAGRDAAVIGPALDGGYYLLGLNRFLRAAFRGVPFGTAAAAARTVAALGAAGFSVATLSALADLDAPRDLRALAGRLCDSSRGEDRALALLLVDTRARAPEAGRARAPAPLFLALDPFGPRGPPALA